MSRHQAPASAPHSSVAAVESVPTRPSGSNGRRQHVSPNERGIDEARQVVRDGERPGGLTAERHGQQEGGVDAQQRDGGDDPHRHIAHQDDWRRDRVGEPDPLQHARYPYGADVRHGIHNVQRQSDRDEDRAASRNVDQHRPACRALRAARECERQRRPDDDDEAREDCVGEGPAIPGRVHEGSGHGAPVARVVDDDHARDGQSAEHVERGEVVADRLHGRWGGRLR